ncbi:MAG: fumarylacetoacetate hydrolase family protein [Acidiferrobacterales bacterium]|nr:fumarylacetoacetate hydrolase family protein [Acidiferrobacterales bacterium]
MTTWVRFSYQNETHFGTLNHNVIEIYEGELFGNNQKNQQTVSLSDVELLTPCTPSKFLALWNNFHATAEKTGLPEPEHPWYFVKTPNSYSAAGSLIRKPAICQGKILFEGELGIVIGKECKDVSVDQAAEYVFGYTCINDVTALEFLFNEEKFAHWIRSKGFDGFGIFGPGITTDVDPDALTIKTFLIGDDQNQERQNYPVSDMFFSPLEIVSKISGDMTLYPGDLIACGTSVGAGAMKHGWTVRVEIDGVGVLENVYQEST